MRLKRKKLPESPKISKKPKKPPLEVFLFIDGVRQKFSDIFLCDALSMVYENFRTLHMDTTDFELSQLVCAVNLMQGAESVTWYWKSSLPLQSRRTRPWSDRNIATSLVGNRNWRSTKLIIKNIWKLQLMMLSTEGFVNQSRFWYDKLIRWNKYGKGTLHLKSWELRLSWTNCRR